MLEERITHYLTDAVRTHGVHTLADSRASEQHAAQVSRLVKETFAEQKVPLARYQLTESRLTTVASQLVGTLAQALPARDKTIGANREALSPNVPPLSDSRALTPAASLATVRQATRAAVAPLVERPAENLRPDSDRSGGAAPSHAAAPLTPGLPTSHRPQDLAAQAHVPPDSRTAWRR